MSQELPNTPQQSEEVDLGQLFNAIGNLFNKFIAFVASIFRSIFSVIIYSIKAVIDNWKILASAVLLATIGGYILEKTKPTTYASQMLVRPYFESKYELISRMDYFNALIASEDYSTLSDIFGLTNEDVKRINSFEIAPGPETENEKLKQYNNYLKSIDSTVVLDQGVTYDNFIENRSIYSGSLFEISVLSTKKDIFPHLEKGINSTFDNNYSRKKMEKRDSMITLQRASLMKDMDEVKRLQKIYIDVIEDEKNQEGNRSLEIGKTGISLATDKPQTREYELLNREIEIRNQLRYLEEKKIEEDVFFDVISGFQAVGTLHVELFERFSIVFPILTLMLLTLIYLFTKLVKYVRNYEA